MFGLPDQPQALGQCGLLLLQPPFQLIRALTG